MSARREPAQVTVSFNSCTRCTLYKTRRKVVWGRGAMPADIMFLGEAPGRVEDLRGEPFIGPSGQLLEEMIADATRIARPASECHPFALLPSYFVTNAVMCHPTERIGGDDRVPHAHEVLACMDNVLTLYKRVNPAVVIFVGKVAARFYAKEFTVHETILHPSFLLRQGGKSSPHYVTTIRKLAEVIGRVCYAT